MPNFTFEYDAGATVTALSEALCATLSLHDIHRVLNAISALPDGTPGLDAACEAIMTADAITTRFTEDEWCDAARAVKSL